MEIIEEEFLDYNVKSPMRIGEILDLAMGKTENNCNAERLLQDFKMYEDGNLRARVERNDFYIR